MNEQSQQLANAREDERIRYSSAKRAIALREESILARERNRMTERRDLMDQTDPTGFAPGSLI